MWQVSIHQQDNVHHFQIKQDGAPINFEIFIDNLLVKPAFRTFYNTILAEAAFEGYFWEHPPISAATVDQAYEFVLIKNRLAHRMKAEPDTFAEYFSKAKQVVDFPNLKGDAHLIVPTPEAEPKYYNHLGNFVRYAPALQQDAFWQRVGEVYQASIQQSKRWLSTAGMGVYWLHVRVDTRPKYYRYGVYRKI